MVGTSAPLKPHAGNWRTATTSLRHFTSGKTAGAGRVSGACAPVDTPDPALLRDPIAVDEVARRQLAAFWLDMRQDHDAFALRQCSEAAVHRLVELTAPRDGTRPTIVVSGRTVEERADSFVEVFTRGVVGDAVGIGGLLIRRAAVTTARKAVDDEAISRQLESPGGRVSFTGELFCMIYKLFLGDVVATVVKTIIQEKIRLVVPVLRLTDPVIDVSGWIAAKIISIIPDPCVEVLDRGPEAALVTIGHDLVAPSVERALGLDGS
jgi:hypothetical protein